MQKQALQSVKHQIVLQQRIVSLQKVSFNQNQIFSTFFEISDIWGACANCMQNVTKMTKRIWMECNYIKIKQFLKSKNVLEPKYIQK